MVTNVIARGLLVMNLGISLNAIAMQEGTLVLKNLSGVAAALKVIISLSDGTISKQQPDGTIKNFAFQNSDKKITLPSTDPNKWLPLEKNKQLELNSPMKIAENLGGKGSLWGRQTQLLLLNRETMKVNIFLLSKITEYAVKLNEQKRFVLMNRETGQIIQPM